MAEAESKIPSLHSVGVVRTVGLEGAVTDSRYVACRRREATVNVARCLDCQHKQNVKYVTKTQPVAVTCFDASDTRSTNRPLELPRLTVGDVMTRNVLCVRPELSLDAVTELFIESGLKAVPVVDENGNLLGILSESEVLLDVFAQTPATPANDPDPAVASGASKVKTRVSAARTVADVMMPFALTLTENAPISQAAAVMAFEGTYRITVLSAEGEVVGILSAADVLYWLAKADGYALPPPKHLKTES